MSRPDPSEPQRRAVNEGGTPRRQARSWLPMGVVVPGLVVLGLVVVLGPALVGQGVLLDVNSLSVRLPFRALTGAVNGDAISCRQDTIDAFPALAQIRHSLALGDLPTWAPYEVGGAPLASLPNTSFLTPLSLPYFLLPLWLAPAFVKLLEVVVAVAGTIAFLRRRGVSFAGAWLAAFVFVTSGFMIMWTNWPQTRVAALIPLLLWATDRVITHHRAKDAVVLAAVFAAMLLGGFPAVTLYALFAAGVFAAVRVWNLYRWQLRQSLGTLGTAGGGLALGLGIAALQMVPFVLNLSAALSDRDKGGTHLPFGAALTLLDPTARGTCQGGQWFGDVIPIESVGYVGSAALVLAVLAIGFRRRRGEEAGIRTWLIATLLVAGTLIWVGGPLLWVWQHLPVIGNNSITRAQSVVGFVLACLVGIGFDRLTRRSTTRDDDRDDGYDDRDGGARQPGSDRALSSSKGRSRPGITLIVAVLVLLAVTVAAVVDAQRDGYLAQLAGSLVVPGLLVIAAAAVVVVIDVRRSWAATWGPLVLVVLVVAQGTWFAHTMLPLSQRDLLYPETPTHRYLEANIGHSRYGAGDRTMDASISDWYHLRSPTGHEFTDPRWKDLLTAVDPDVLRSPTYSAFAPALPFDRIIQSAVLNRLAVRYWTANPRRAVGSVEPLSSKGSVQLTQDEPTTCRVDAGPLRGINLYIAEPMDPPAPGTTPKLTVRVTAGGETRTGSVLLAGSGLGPGQITIAVAGEDLPRGKRARVQVSLSGTDQPRFFAGEDDRPFCSAVRPSKATDQVRLVFADAGAAIYERLDALPRIRWASRSQVVDPDRQVAALQGDLSDDTVLLDDDTSPAADGGTGSLSIVSDSAERIAVDTDSTGQGYVVVADSLVRPGWSATVDGRPAPLVRADHAFGAVPVPGGQHQVVLTYDAPGLRAGTVVSIVSLLAAAGLVALPAFLRRRRRDLPETGPRRAASASGPAKNRSKRIAGARPRSPARTSPGR